MVCGKSFEQERYLKDHINSVHIKSVKCEFCEYTVAPRRRRRLQLHMQRRHNFPVPPVMLSQNPASTTQPAPETTVPDHQYEQTVSSDIGGTSDVNFWHTNMDLDTPETDAIQLDISTDISFDSLVEDSDDLPPQPLPYSTLLDPPTPCLDERPSPVFPLFPDLDLDVALFSPMVADTPPLQGSACEPEVAQEVIATSDPIPCTQTELQTAVQSILPRVRYRDRGSGRLHPLDL